MKEIVLCFKYIKISTKTITKPDREIKIESKQKLQENKNKKTNKQLEEWTFHTLTCRFELW